MLKDLTKVLEQLLLEPEGGLPAACGELLRSRDLGSSILVLFSREEVRVLHDGGTGAMAPEQLVDELRSLGEDLLSRERIPLAGKRWAVGRLPIADGHLVLLLDRPCPHQEDVLGLLHLLFLLAGRIGSEGGEGFSVINDLGDAVLVLDQDLRVVQANARAVQLITPEQSVPVGRNFVELLGASAGERFLERCHQSYRGKIKPFSLRLVGGSQLECTLARRQVGGAAGHLVALRDLSRLTVLEDTVLLQNKNLTILNELSRSLTNLFNLDQLFDLLLPKAFRDIGVDYIFMFRAETGGSSYRITNSYHGEHTPELPAGLRRSVELGSNFPLAPHDVTQINHFGKRMASHAAEQLNLPPDSIRLALPLRSRERVHGFMVFLNVDARRRLDAPSTYDMLVAICQHLVAAMESSELLRRTVKAKSEWETTFDSITDFIRIQSLDFEILRSNRHFAEYFDLSPERLHGEKCYRLIYGRTEICPDCPAKETLRQRTICSREFCYRRHGKEEHIACWTYPVLDEQGQLTSMVVYSRDITKEKQLQQQLLQSEKMASIGQLVAGIAHEINTPLAYVSSNLEIMEEYLGGLQGFHARLAEVQAEVAVLEREFNTAYLLKDFHEALADALDGVGRIKTIVKELKNFTHASNDEFEPADLNEIVASTLSLVRNELKYKVEVERRLGEVPRIICVPIQISQVLLNLFVNAAQAIDERGNLGIETFAEDRHVVIIVRDTGKGIPRHLLGRIFDPFFTTKEVGVGTGLGLSVSYEIIKRHHGTIEVESEVDRGTVFTVRLPIVQEG